MFGVFFFILNNILCYCVRGDLSSAASEIEVYGKCKLLGYALPRHLPLIIPIDKLIHAAGNPQSLSNLLWETN